MKNRFSALAPLSSFAVIEAVVDHADDPYRSADSILRSEGSAEREQSQSSDDDVVNLRGFKLTCNDRRIQDVVASNLLLD